MQVSFICFDKHQFNKEVLHFEHALNSSGIIIPGFLKAFVFVHRVFRWIMILLILKSCARVWRGAFATDFLLFLIKSGKNGVSLLWNSGMPDYTGKAGYKNGLEPI